MLQQKEISLFTKHPGTYAVALTGQNSCDTLLFSSDPNTISLDPSPRPIFVGKLSSFPHAALGDQSPEIIRFHTFFDENNLLMVTPKSADSLYDLNAVTPIPVPFSKARIGRDSVLFIREIRLGDGVDDHSKRVLLQVLASGLVVDSSTAVLLSKGMRRVPIPVRKWMANDRVEESCKKEVFDAAEVIGYKPIIYLYPADTTELSVKLTFTSGGKFTYTYPTYPNSGWNVTACPDGKLIDRSGKSYYSLFWEGELPTLPDDSTGFVVHRDSLNSFFEDALDSLGLNYKEKQEFIVYWSPKLMANEYSFIHFSRKKYANSVKMEITPAPAAINRFLMLYRKSSAEEKPVPQRLKNPGRNGFTVVEWGGAEMKRKAPQQTSFFEEQQKEYVIPPHVPFSSVWGGLYETLNSSIWSESERYGKFTTKTTTVCIQKIPYAALIKPYWKQGGESCRCENSPFPQDRFILYNPLRFNSILTPLSSQYQRKEIEIAEVSREGVRDTLLFYGAGCEGRVIGSRVRLFEPDITGRFGLEENMTVLFNETSDSLNFDFTEHDTAGTTLFLSPDRKDLEMFNFWKFFRFTLTDTVPLKIDNRYFFTASWLTMITPQPDQVESFNREREQVFRALAKSCILPKSVVPILKTEDYRVNDLPEPLYRLVRKTKRSNCIGGSFRPGGVMRMGARPPKVYEPFRVR